VETPRIRVAVREIRVKRGSIELVPRGKPGSVMVLREFQERLVRSLCGGTRYIGLEAPTGAGKTSTLLAPYIANALCGKGYQGVVAVYPAEPLVGDQFLSLRSMLEALGERAETVKGGDGLELAIKYRVSLRVIDRGQPGGVEGEAEGTVGVVRLTGEALDRLKEHLERKGEGAGRPGLLQMIREVLVDADYLVVVAVPEYPYTVLSSAYRSAEEAQKVLGLALGGGFVYRLAEKIAAAGGQGLESTVLEAKREMARVLQGGHQGVEGLDIYSALFPGVLFLDEFHMWGAYERPTVLALVLLHHMLSLSSARPEAFGVVFSSATPQEDVYRFIEGLGLGRVEVIRAEPAKDPDNTDVVKGRTTVEFYPVSTEPTRGPTAWLKAGEAVPGIVEEYRDSIVASGRAVVFAGRAAVAEEAADRFRRATGKTPAVITGVRTGYPGEEALWGRESGVEAFVFTSYPLLVPGAGFGIACGAGLSEVVQRLGRVGRGGVYEALAVIPVPRAYADTIRSRVERAGGEVDYAGLIEILGEVMPGEPGAEALGTGFIMGHKLGKLRLYAPLAAWILTQIYTMGHPVELQKLCRVFIDIVDRLGVGEIFGWLERAVDKSPEVLIPIASFRISYAVPYARPTERGVVEGTASLSTLLGDYRASYDREGKKVAVEGVSKRPLPVAFTMSCRYVPREHLGIIVRSDRFIDEMKRAVYGNYVLISVLRDRPVPLYIAPLDEGGELSKAYETLTAHGYAIRFELPGGRAFYAVIV